MPLGLRIGYLIDGSTMGIPVDPVEFQDRTRKVDSLPDYNQIIRRLNRRSSVNQTLQPKWAQCVQSFGDIEGGKTSSFGLCGFFPSIDCPLIGRHDSRTVRAEAR